jgi:peptide chain release factor 1
VTKAGRRRDDPPSTGSEGRTLYADFEDGSWLRPLAGSHRVQRIPKGASARHTSTATLALLDSDSSTAITLDEGEIEERFDRGSGKGGQHQNTTDSAVTLTHIPTGISVHIEGRKQWNNRQDARRVLVERLRERAAAEALHIRNAERTGQVAGSDRAAKGFTHNHQRGEVIDHDTGKRWPLDRWAKGRF